MASSSIATSRPALSNSGGSHAQSALGADVEYSRGYWLVRSELVWSRWNVPFATPAASENVDALGAWVEARYRVTPRIVVSGRADRLGFSRLDGRSEPGADLGRERLRASRPTAATTSSATSSRGSRCSTTSEMAAASASARTFPAQVAYWF